MTGRAPRARHYGKWHQRRLDPGHPARRALLRSATRAACCLLDPADMPAPVTFI
jgi:hypothetical protein